MTARTRTAAFYVVTGSDFFPGAVALLNSLRLQGHREPVLVLDCGMLSWQRELLDPHATVIAAPEDLPPSLLKLVLPLERPAPTMVLLDADVIVTRPLGELIERAAADRLVAFRNDRPRFFAEWAELLELPDLAPAPYVSSSAVFVGGGPADRVLPLAHERQLRVDPDRTWVGGGSESDPLYYLDQDVLNAVVGSRLSGEEVVALEHRLAPSPPFKGLRVRDEAGLQCAYRDRTEPFLLHHWSLKPWLVPVRRNAYTRLLIRLLLGPDVPVRFPGERLPRRLRTGVAAEAERVRLDLTLALPGIRRRLKRAPTAGTAWPNRRASGR